LLPSLGQGECKPPLPSKREWFAGLATEKVRVTFIDSERFLIARKGPSWSFLFEDTSRGEVPDFTLNWRLICPESESAATTPVFN
jgi:hypothetical protein